MKLALQGRGCYTYFTISVISYCIEQDFKSMISGADFPYPRSSDLQSFSENYPERILERGSSDKHSKTIKQDRAENENTGMCGHKAVQACETTREDQPTVPRHSVESMGG